MKSAAFQRLPGPSSSRPMALPLIAVCPGYLALSVFLLTSLLSTRVGACEGPLSLAIHAEGEDVRFTWTGSLAPGERFALYNFPLEELGAGSPEEIGTAVYVGTNSGFFHDSVVEVAYALTCEDPSRVVSARSNMAFRLPYTLSRSFDRERSDEWDYEHHQLSMPLLSGMRDVDGSGVEAPCDGLAEGVFTPFDLLCEFWDPSLVNTATFTVEVEDVATGSWLSGLGFKPDGGVPRVLGSAVDLDSPERQGRGILVRLEGNVADYSGVLVGAHDDSFTGVRLSNPSPASRHLLSVPYHTRYETAVEVACGLRGVDWLDEDGDGWPDTCEGGIFQPSPGTPRQDCLLSIDAPPSTRPGSDGFWQRFRVKVNFLFEEPFFEAADFELEPGMALQVSFIGECEDVVFLSPHF